MRDSPVYGPGLCVCVCRYIYSISSYTYSSRAPPSSRYAERPLRPHTSAYVSIRQHTSAYVSIRQHTSAYVITRRQAGMPSVNCLWTIVCVCVCTYMRTPSRAIHTPPDEFVRETKRCTLLQSRMPSVHCLWAMFCSLCVSVVI